MQSHCVGNGFLLSEIVGSSRLGEHQVAVVDLCDLLQCFLFKSCLLALVSTFGMVYN